MNGFRGTSDVNSRLFTLLLTLCSHAGCLRVTVPADRLLAVRGRPVILGCEFSPDLSSTSTLSELVVTWQREENDQVVHSFYYEQDQLNTQSLMYQNRTALFLEELAKGNASLRIEPVGHQDVGRYVCLVSTTQGTDKAVLKLDYGAFYTEPKLSISVHSSTNITLQYEAEGFPLPEVSWLGNKGENLTHQTEIFQDVQREAGLLHVKSSHIAHVSALNITFVLKNQLLSQDLQRLVNLKFADDISKSTGVVTILAIFCVLLCVAVLIFGWLYYKNKK